MPHRDTPPARYDQLQDEITGGRVELIQPCVALTVEFFGDPQVARIKRHRVHFTQLAGLWDRFTMRPRSRDFSDLRKILMNHFRPSRHTVENESNKANAKGRKRQTASTGNLRADHSPERHASERTRRHRDGEAGTRWRCLDYSCACLSQWCDACVCQFECCVVHAGSPGERTPRGERALLRCGGGGHRPTAPSFRLTSFDKEDLDCPVRADT